MHPLLRRASGCPGGNLGSLRVCHSPATLIFNSKVECC
jgi:hypothetical protein